MKRLVVSLTSAQTGHMSRDCPEPKQSSGYGGGGNAYGSSNGYGNTDSSAQDTWGKADSGLESSFDKMGFGGGSGGSRGGQSCYKCVSQTFD